MQETVYANPWFRVQREGKMHWIDEKSSPKGAVIVGEIDSHLVFVKVYRAAHNATFIELPRGYAEDNETYTEAGLREFKEETGLEADECTHLGEILPNSSILSTRVQVIHAKAKQSMTPVELDSEINDVIFVPKKEIDSLILKGNIVDGMSLAALALLNARQ